MSLEDRVNYPNLSRYRVNYYVYGFYHKDEIFYVGKGKGRRCLVHFADKQLEQNNRKNSKIKSILNKGEKVQVRILACNLSERDALLFEDKLIKEFGLISEGGCLYNHVYGSVTGSFKWTEEHRNFMSKRLRGVNSNATPQLVEKAKLLAHYRGFSAQQISELDEFSGYTRITIANWCAGRKYSYIRPDLNFGHSLSEEKRQMVYKMYDQGFTQNEIHKILGIDHGSISYYMKSYSKEG